jgi:hypothetical protein
MEMESDAAIGRPEKIHPLDRLARLALVVYFSPVILVFLAIGLIGLIINQAFSPAPKVRSLPCRIRPGLRIDRIPHRSSYPEARKSQVVLAVSPLPRRV